MKKGLYLPLLHKNITARTATENNEINAQENENNEIQQDTITK